MPVFFGTCSRSTRYLWQYAGKCKKYINWTHRNQKIIFKFLNQMNYIIFLPIYLILRKRDTQKHLRITVEKEIEIEVYVDLFSLEPKLSFII